jgi:hypothetical protein
VMEKLENQSQKMLSLWDTNNFADFVWLRSLFRLASPDVTLYVIMYYSNFVRRSNFPMNSALRNAWGF